MLLLLVFNSCSEDDSKKTSLSITGFSPSEGIEGTTVLITGTAFSENAEQNIVTFNGIEATVSAATSRSLTVTVPEGFSTGKVGVQVASQRVTSTDDFVSVTITVSTLAGSSEGFTDGSGTDAQFKYPAGVTIDASGYSYIADYYNYSVRKITPDGAVSTLAGNGTLGFAEGTGSEAQFNTPAGVGVDASGNVYVGDITNHRVRKITSSGVVSTLAGSGSVEGYADGVGEEARFGTPRGVAVDGAGNVYVADETNNCIRKITPDGVVTTLAGSTTPGSADGTGRAAQFLYPNGVAVDALGNVYVADTGNHRIRKITPGGVVSTLAGSTEGIADGVGLTAQFKGPLGVAADAAGNIYVTQYGNSLIRKITPGGVVNTLAGNGTAGSADGPGSAAQFSGPRGITVDALGNVYVADSGNHRIRRITVQ
jgi:sugar lactone lactonase YvrE